MVTRFSAVVAVSALAFSSAAVLGPSPGAAASPSPSPAGGAGAPPPASARAADLVLRNGRIYTMGRGEAWAQAVAVRNGEIAYVGGDSGVAAHTGPRTRVIDLAGRMALPGFVDGHNHAYLMAESLFWLSLNPYGTVRERQAALRAYRERNPAAAQVRGVGWDGAASDAKAAGVMPKELLDAVVPDVPVVIISNGHHSLLVNSKALELAGITKDTQDPPGGVIERDEKTGEPNGIVHEFSAQNLVINALPQPDFTVGQYRQTIAAWQKAAAADGITSAFVPVHYPTTSLLEAFEAMDEAGELTVRFDLGLWADENRGTEQVDDLVALRARYQGGKYRIDTVKIFSDGVGAGRLVWDQRVLEETVAALDRKGFRVYVHAIGNPEFYPSGNALDAFEYAARKNGPRDSRHVVTHADWVRERDVRRFKRLGAIPVPQPPWFGKDWYDDVPKNKLKNLNRFQSYLDAGIPVVSSSDFPSSDTFERDMYPLTGIEAGMTRLDPATTREEDLDRAAWPRERASLHDMIASYTVNGARMIFAERERGSIEVGKKADLVVLDQNLFEIPVTRTSETKVLLTLFEGAETYRDPSFR
ncbi:amidohydrolase [Bailinhaonella thermotolerans]|uniref:Amidohydrolase n=1 Tax=Bailinhaonella thermotolerans TaxID=1070861 RepID=A0A3A4AZ73_9ACTN|nr:amidohydrolase [Bailinhaonella thermotolerans]RJL32826.1 amidohydrolase [Bailinhaonella thermotolerans]